MATRVTFTTERGNEVHAKYNFEEGRCYLQIYGNGYARTRNFDMGLYMDAQGYCEDNGF